MQKHTRKVSIIRKRHSGQWNTGNLGFNTKKNTF